MEQLRLIFGMKQMKNTLKNFEQNELEYLDQMTAMWKRQQVTAC